MNDRAVVLLVDGQEYAGWKRATVSRSIDAVCGSFNISLTRLWKDGRLTPAIRAGMECSLYCNDHLVLTGYVDDALPSYDARQHSIQVRGRSKARDMVDCGEKPRQWQNRSLLQIARDLAKGRGVTVRADKDVGAVFTSQAIEPGQTAFEFLEGLARQRGVRFISEPDGTLVIAGTGNELAPTALELGRNIKTASGGFSMRDRFHEYIVYGQRPGDDWNHGEASALRQGSATDDAVNSNRSHVILSETTADSADCKRRATWKRNTAFGRGQALTYTVYGWEHANGLWEPNTLVRVIDSFMGFDDEQFLISSLQYVLDKEGQRTELQLMPPEAFELMALPDKKEPAKWTP